MYSMSLGVHELLTLTVTIHYKLKWHWEARLLGELLIINNGIKKCSSKTETKNKKINKRHSKQKWKGYVIVKHHMRAADWTHNLRLSHKNFNLFSSLSNESNSVQNNYSARNSLFYLDCFYKKCILYE